MPRFALDRSRPPARALEWAASAVRDGAHVLRVRSLAGGSSSAVHAVTVEDARSSCVELVLRRYVAPEVLAEDPDLVTFEASVLRLLAGSEVAAPRLAAIDEHARHADVPAVLMTRLPGRIELAPRDPARYVEGLAAALAPVHAVPPHAAIPSCARYHAPADDREPPWPHDAAAWRALIAYAAGPPPAAAATFIHRDYHPANVLWSRARAPASSTG